ncbi:hypothetical protein [uncultured Roseobacter sp.]|uniref:hypothetical protein n=1 Tax=uncultured Roseobacter sp. TaxID=114847 RepID=UPI0026148FA5|nr:hypothetical protein [uncultured Roseobacter sp.]
MSFVVVITDAYCKDRRLRSIQDLKRFTGLEDLAQLKKEICLIEGKKMLPAALAKELMATAATVDVVHDDYGVIDHFTFDNRYLSEELLGRFECPVGAFTIYAPEQDWIVHTRDDEAWMYCLLPEAMAQYLVDVDPDVAEIVSGSFPYN